MHDWTTLVLTSGIDVDDAWALLEARGIVPLFVTETPGKNAELVVPIALDALPEALPFVLKALPCSANQEIDWTAQWEAHGHDFREGCVHVRVGQNELKLLPGPGFGDLSHPTTQLVLDLMTPCCQGRVVLDIGSGSGILTLAAATLGASHAYGVDIDEKAIAHASQNAVLNGLEARVTFAMDAEVIPEVIVMNMIWSEQRLAWQRWADVAYRASDLIVSGILTSERMAYLDYIGQWGWHLKQAKAQNDWLAVHLTRA